MYIINNAHDGAIIYSIWPKESFFIHLETVGIILYAREMLEYKKTLDIIIIIILGAVIIF